MASRGSKRKSANSVVEEVNGRDVRDSTKKKRTGVEIMEEVVKEEIRKGKKRSTDSTSEYKSKRATPFSERDHEPLRNGTAIDYDSDDEEEVDDRFFPIAVVGIGCRFPGDVNTTHDFERIMEEGIDTISEIPADRWDMDKYWHPDPHNVGTHANRKAGFTKEPHHFDHTFFNISPREAANMDVQQRGLLEVTQEAMDDAGIPSDKLPKNTGVYIGLCLMDHGFTVIEDAKCMNAYTHTGTAHSIAANRISYAYDIRGPSVAIDTACAASLTSMHYAAFALWNKECPVAIVGGSNTLVVPEVTVGFNALGVLSPEGKSCPFSANAKGYVRSEGTGVFILKPLADAIKDGNNVYCTIRASWLAHNGYSLSITMPSSDAQADMMMDSYKYFGFNPDKIDFVEAHGTGTPVGDPIEAEGVATAFAKGNKNRKKPLAVGSSKSNFGHLEGAAGMVQATKAALMLYHRKIYPNINFGSANPAIDCDNWNIYVPTELQKFKEQKRFRIGVNTFGFGGALAHMMFEEYVPKLEYKTPNKGQAGWTFGGGAKKGLKMPIPLSAKSGAALKAYCESWKNFESSDDAQEVVGWLATRRTHYPSRLCVFADSSDDFREKMQMYIDKIANDEVVEGTLPPNDEKKSIAFVFPGQGQQHFNMGRKLYEEEPVFRKAVDDCDALYKKLSGKSFCKTYNLFTPLQEGKKYNPDIVNEIQVSQPAILFLQVGLFHLMEHWGIKPCALVGHSLGEVAAAYASGAVTLEEAITVQYYRAEQQVRLDGSGTMAAMRVSAEEGEKLCKKYKDLYVACNNAHESITIAGSVPVVRELCAQNPGNAKELRVKCAFHTPHMDPLHNDFMKAVKNKLSNGKGHKYDWYSTVTGDKYDGPASAQYFWDNIRGRVEFLGAVRGIMRDHKNVVWLELAGAATLLSSVRQIAKGEDNTPAGLVATGQRNKDDRISTMRSLATLFTMGVDIDWDSITNHAAKWMKLPHYAWQHSYFRYEAEGMRSRRLDLEDRSYTGLFGILRLEQLPFLRDHMIKGQLCFPRSGFVEYMMQTQFDQETNPALRNITFNKDFLELPEEVDLNGEIPERKALGVEKLQIQNGSRLMVFADGIQYATADAVEEKEMKAAVIDIDAMKKKCKKSLDADAFYEMLHERGVDYEDYVRFKAVEEAYIGDGEAVAFLHPQLDKRERINTIALDAGFTVALASQVNQNTLLTPSRIDSIRMHVPKLPRKERLVVYSSLQAVNRMGLKADIFIMNESGSVLAEVRGFEAMNLTDSETAKIDLTDCVYTTEFQPIDACMPSTSMMRDFFKAKNLQKLYPQEMVMIENAEKYCAEVKEICGAYAKIAVEQTPENQYHDKMVRYAKRLQQMAADVKQSYSLDDLSAKIARINKDCPEFYQEMIMIERMGKILADSLKDPRGALTELFTEDMMGQYFIDSITVRIYYKCIADTVKLACEEARKKKQVVRVAEIGGRLGGLTKYILAAIEEYLKDGTVDYTFTDINVAFFTHVQETLANFPAIKYQQFDPETNIKAQSMTPNAFDLIVCLDTLHCTEDGVVAASNIRDLLCNDGWLMLMESTNNHNTPEIIFGAFDLCWIFEDERKERCWMSQSGWNGVMEKAGFSDVLSVSTPNEFFHSLVVGRKTNNELFYPRFIEAKEDEELPMDIEGTPLWVAVHHNEENIANALKGHLSRDAKVCNVSKLKTMQKTLSGHQGPVNIVYFWNESDKNLSETLSIVQTCQTLGERPNSNLIVITRQGSGEANSIEGSVAVGFMRAACSEVKNMSVFHIDVDQVGTNGHMTELVKLMKSHTHNDREISLRNNTRFVPRVIRRKLNTKMTMSNVDWRVEASSTNGSMLDSVDFHHTKCVDPKQGEVKIRVNSVAIHRKDGMAAAEEKRENDITFGLECSGIVESAGPGVTHIKPSDQVVAFGDSCLASSVITSSDLVFKKPNGLSNVDVAASSLTYASVYYAMVDRANIQQDETVLVHSACGGIGQAALQLSKVVGAKLIVTAGSEEKRDILRRQCGLSHVSDSRSGAFYDDVMKWTNGRGVDVVINLVGGDVLEKSIGCLAHGGRLCQIGNEDVFSNTRLVMEAFQKNCALHAVQIDRLMQDNPAKFRSVVEKVLEMLGKHQLEALPSKVSDISSIHRVLNEANGSDHIGRFVVEVPSNYTPESMEPSLQLFNSDDMYVITGSSGGVGQTFARWVAEKGARHIALISKNGHKSWFQQDTVRYLESMGVVVYDARADMSREKDVKEVFRVLTATGRPAIKGIFHLAGVNEECDLENMTSANIAKELKVRVNGALHLDKISRDMRLNLDYFVLFSSSKVSWGNPRLAAFCAACSGLDALAQQRRRQNLPALSLQVGWLRGAGWLEDKDRSAGLVEYTKGCSLHINEFLSILHKLLPREDLPPIVMVSNEDWDAVNDATYSDALLFRHYATAGGKRRGGTDLSKDDLEKKVVEKLGNLLMMSPDDIDTVQPMIHYGVDSLISLDITNWMRKEFNLQINQMDILEGMTTASLIEQALA